MPSSSSSSLFVGWKSSTNHGKFLTKTALSLSLRRGLEVRPTGGATPSEGGMTLYLKAGPDGTSSVGDCPFAHFVRMVLEEKGLDYELRPCGNDEDKPTWLLEHYEGKMPALRHGQECYIESDVIAQYLDFFFPNPNLALPKKKFLKEAQDSVDGIFPAIAKYLKHSSNNDETDEELKADLIQQLKRLETHLSSTTSNRTGPYLVGDGQHFTLLDCSLAPKLYHLKIGLDAFKKESPTIDIAKDFPNLDNYMTSVFARPSFVASMYPTETVVWGWENARRKQ
eukprot:CAMPEP_0172425528 /NCGR_PEP_ID=MMETSP1064-20121228/32531_1 /TAXON_ID=202472 /ORGANISM="Aulacoseira subarctica , Strain CCAP 1002/5" /LENGTH=281 /DNA_ID=CAMNT_0013168469 /DNA_START=165 /DNA_END=1010 /DNA_ORIENTATION=+